MKPVNNLKIFLDNTFAITGWSRSSPNKRDRPGRIRLKQDGVPIHRRGNMGPRLKAQLLQLMKRGGSDIPGINETSAVH